MRLLLMRHAKSDWSRGLPDHERVLNARGQRSAAALGDWLREKGHLPGEALVSDARRTVLTFEGLRLEGLMPTLRPELYHADPGEMLAVLRGASAPVVLMIGHNPGIGDLAGALVAAPAPHPDFGRYPTGATTVIDWAAESWAEVAPHAGRAVDFVIPRELPGSG